MTINQAQLSSKELQQQDAHGWFQGLLGNSSCSLESKNCNEDEDLIKRKALVVAPMVEQSDLPFRLLCRKYGANLCYTPMFHARMFLTRPRYRAQFWNLDVIRKINKQDRPLIVQFCGGDPKEMLKAAKVVEDHCDAVDVNCGCPQGIARRGNYGAFLLEKEELLLKIVRVLHEGLKKVPVTVKVRLLPPECCTMQENGCTCQSDGSVYCLESSLSLYERLIDAGAAILTVHCRTRHQKGHNTGAADWSAVRQVVERLGHRIPIIANGGIANMDDVEQCLLETKADGVMSSEAVLEYPPIFERNGSHTKFSNNKRTGPGRVALCNEYLDIAEEYPPDVGGQGSGMKCVRTHIHHFLSADLESNPTVRDMTVSAKSNGDLRKALQAIELYHNQSNMEVKDETQHWYFRHRCENKEGKMVSKTEMFGKSQILAGGELNEETAKGIACLFGNCNEASDY